MIAITAKTPIAIPAITIPLMAMELFELLSLFLSLLVGDPVPGGGGGAGPNDHEFPTVLDKTSYTKTYETYKINDDDNDPNIV